MKVFTGVVPTSDVITKPNTVSQLSQMQREYLNTNVIPLNNTLLNVYFSCTLSRNIAYIN